MPDGFRRAITPGERALLLYPPGLDFIAAFFGCLYAGVLAVPVLPPQGGRARRGVDRLAPSSRTRRRGARSPPPSFISNWRTSRRDGLLGTIELGTPWVATDQLPSDLGDAWSPMAVDREHDRASFSTPPVPPRTPKGVMVTHGNLLHNLRAAFYLGDTGPASVSVSWLPVTHDMGLIEGVLQPAFSGCPAYLMSPGAFLQRPVRWLRAISTYMAPEAADRISPTTSRCNRVSAGRPRQGSISEPWHAAYNGAEPIRHDTMGAFAAAYEGAGFDAAAFRPCYGLAESTFLVTQPGRWTASTAPKAADVSCGWPRSALACGSSIRPRTCSCARTVRSERFRSQARASPTGYWNRPHETSGTFGDCVNGSSERWLRTGDLGFMRDGELYVTGRIKDLLIVRGAKHFPQDLERTAELQHHAVRPGAVAAVAVANGVRGDRIALVAEVDSRQTRTIVTAIS